jgi:hypothetical protein
MATPAKVKLRAASLDNSLESVYGELVVLMKRHAPPFRPDVPCGGGGKKSFQLTVPKPVAVPGAYGGKPVDLQFAAAILQKGYVGFYLMCIYVNQNARKQISPALLKLLKGKSCFHLKKLDDGLRQDIQSALALGAEFYKQRGWL